MRSSRMRGSAEVGEDASCVLTAAYVRGASGKDDLVKRLREVMLQLSQQEQDADHSSLTSLAEALASPTLVRHRDRDVKLLTACCLVDILRIFVPDAPYSREQLFDVFTLLIQQLRGLKTTDSPSFIRHFYVLQRLATVKCSVILVELEAEDLLSELFQTLFACIQEQHSADVEMYILEVFLCVVEEVEYLPQVVLDTILSHILSPLRETNPRAYRLAVQVVERGQNVLLPPVTSFLTEVLSGGGSNESDLKDRVHDLVLALNEIAPSLLLYVLPKLSEDLQNENLEARMAVVQLFGRIFARSDAAVQWRSIFREYVGRFSDLNAGIRTTMVEQTPGIVEQQPNLAEEIGVKLVERMKDVDERVRRATVQVIGRMGSKDLETITDAELFGLRDRCRDKKLTVRKEALGVLALLFRQFGCQQRIKQLHWIPGAVLQCWLIPDAETRQHVEALFNEMVAGTDKDETVRAEAILSVCAELQPDSWKVLERILAEKCLCAGFQRAIYRVLDLWNKQKSAPDDQAPTLQMNRIFDCLVEKMPDPLRARDMLVRLMQMKDNKVFKLLGVVADSASDSLTTKAAREELVKKWGSKAPMVDMLRALLERMDLQALSSDTMPALLVAIENEAKHDNPQRAIGGLHLLRDLETVFSGLVAPVLDRVVSLLARGGEVAELAVRVIAVVVESTKTIHAETQSTLRECLPPLSGEGTAKEAKFASRSLALLFRNEQSVLHEILEELQSQLFPENVHLVSVLKSLGEFARLAPEGYAALSELITDFVVYNVILHPPVRITSLEDEDEDEDWNTVDGSCQVVIAGMKLLVHHVWGLPENQAIAAEPVSKLLCAILEHGGDVAALAPPKKTKKKKEIPLPRLTSSSKDHIRLAAATSLLRLARLPIVDAILAPPQFQLLSWTMQDPIFDVRKAFAEKLNHYLTKNARPLLLKFLCLFVLAALDPEKENVMAAKHYMASIIKRHRSSTLQTSGATAVTSLVEYVLVHLVHMLAHHPDLPEDHPAYRMFVKYFTFFFDQVQVDNLPVLTQILKTIRSSDDAQTPGNNSILLLSDLALLILHQKSLGRKVSTTTQVGSIPLPQALYRPEPLESRKSVESYLPPNFTLTLTGSKKEGPAYVSPPPLSPTTKRRGGSTETSPSKRVAYDEDEESSEEEVHPEVSPPRRMNPSRSTRGSTRSSPRVASRVVPDDNDEPEVAHRTLRRRRVH